MNWFATHRQEWIAETLRVFGFLNREHLMRKFGMSMPQASQDIANFLTRNPGKLEYDKTLKRYVSTGD